MSAAPRRRAHVILRAVAARLPFRWRRSVPELLTVTAVADLCGVTRETVYRWERAGYIRRAASYRAPGGGLAGLYRREDAVRLGDRRRREWRPG